MYNKTNDIDKDTILKKELLKENKLNIKNNSNENSIKESFLEKYFLIDIKNKLN